LSAISKFEFLVGTKLSQIRQTEKIIEGFYILSFNSNVAEVASDIAKN
jgi:predicted nucleic acid-binding protein